MDVRELPQTGFREPYSGYVAQLLQELGPVPDSEWREGPEAVAAASRGLLVGSDIRPDVQHDVPLVRYLPRWFNPEELESNTEAVAVTSQYDVGGQSLIRLRAGIFRPVSV